jgi:integrase
MTNPKGKTALTELRCEKLPVTAKTYYVQDGAQSGLSVRVSAGGVRAFIFTKHKHGKLTRITLGRVGAMRLDAARKAAQALHGELAMGVDIGAKRKQAALRHEQERAAGVTLEQAYEKFLTLKTRRPRTLESYETIWRLHVPAPLKRKPVADITPADIESAVRTAGKQHRTANLIVVLIGAIMAKSGRWADNPARGVTRHAEHPRTRRLGMDELARAWAAARSDPEWGDFFRLLILTGARRSPFQAMRWSDLDLDAGVWVVPVDWSKNKKELAVPLSSEAVQILRERLERTRAVSAQSATNDRNDRISHSETYPVGKSPWVFPSADSKTGHVINPVKAWARLLKSAGVQKHASLHDVRRTLGSRLAMSGVTGQTIGSVLGHLSPQSLKAYVHLDTSAGSAAIDNLFYSIITPPSKSKLPNG